MMTKNETRNLNFDAETLYELQSLQLSVLLFSICHIVLVVQDWISDLDVWKFIRTTQMMKQKLPDIVTALGNTVSVPTTGTKPEETKLGYESEFYPQVVFVYNKIPVDCFSENYLAGLSAALDQFFPDSLKSDRVFFPHLFTTNGSRETEKHANFFLLPLNECLHPNLGNSNLLGFGSYDTTVNYLCNQLLSMKKLFQKPVSEKDWLRNAFHLWDVIKRSQLIHEYQALFQTSQLNNS